MKAFRRSVQRLKPLIAPAMILLTIIGFHGQPALWIPLVLALLRRGSWASAMTVGRK